MLKRIKAVMVLLALLQTNLVYSDAIGQSLEQQAQALVKTFAGQLKPRLKAAIQEGGYAHAIEVCSRVAPQIASDLSANSGWQIKRVSLKPRNTASAQPDDWERQVLRDFDAKAAQGVPAGELNVAATVDHRFRYMQAQLVGPVCLGCHGQALTDDVKKTLAEYMPNDRATGYSLGQVRGAISLSIDSKALQ